jgi:plastocyanin
MRGGTRVLLTGALARGALACSSGGGGDDATCEEPVASTDVTMTDFAFAPTCIEAAAGDTLSLVNSGEAPHTFTLGAVGLESDVASGATGELALDGVTAGTTYEVTCSYHPQMVAALRVT